MQTAASRRWHRNILTCVVYGLPARARRAAILRAPEPADPLAMHDQRELPSLPGPYELCILPEVDSVLAEAVRRAQAGAEEGTLLWASSQRDARTRTLDVILAVEAGERDLRDGDLVDVAVPREIADTGFWLARTALTEGSRGLWSVYVARPLSSPEARAVDLHQLERRQVEVLHAMEDRVYVRGALLEGEHVVSGGLQRLSPKQRVRI